MKDVKAILTQSGFKLKKFMSNDRQIVKMIPEEERGKPLLNIDLDKQELPRDRALANYCSQDDFPRSYQTDSHGMNKCLTSYSKTVEGSV